MGDKEEMIEYTPEELEEIERIRGVVATAGKRVSEEEAFTPDEPVLEQPGINIGEPEDLDLPMGDLDSISGETALDEFDDTSIEPDVADIPLDELEDLVPDTGEEIPGAEELPIDELTSEPEDVDFGEFEGFDEGVEVPGEPDLSDVKHEDLEDLSGGDIEDISDLIEEVEEPEGEI